MKILLISLNRETEPFTAAPLGMALVCASLEAGGHEIRALDLLFSEDPAVDIREAVEGFGPELVGLSLRNIESSTEFLMPSYRKTVSVIRGVTSAPIVVGGPGFSVMPEQALRYLGVEYGIKGEGELAASKLALALEKGLDPTDIPGVCSVKDGAFTLSPRKIVEELDALPEPSWASLPMEGYDMVGVQSKRGCSFNCAYCTYPSLEGRRMRPRFPEAVASEIGRLGAEYGVSSFYFVDNVFNNPVSHAFDVCASLKKLDTEKHWGCLASPLGLDGRLLDAMAEAGCESVEIGADSLSDRALKGLGKPFGSSEVRQAVDRCKEAGMAHMLFLILGGPGEDEDTLKETFDALDRLSPDKVFAVAGIRVYPSTPIHKLAVETGIVTPDDNLLSPRFYVSDRLGERLYGLAEGYFRDRPGWIYYRASAVLDKKPASGPIAAKWDEAADRCLATVIKEVPMLLRPVARKAVIRRAGALAEQRGLASVSTVEVVDAFMEETPGPFRPVMEKSLRKFGLIE